MQRTINRIIIVSISVFLLYSGPIMAKRSRPLVWDMRYLESLKNEKKTSTIAQDIIDAADQICMADPVSVIAKQKTFAPNSHYYCSVGPYWWPDSSQNGIYIRKDGYINPESESYDLAKLTELAKRCRILSQAFFISENKKYKEAFVCQLKVWFINENTIMYPNFEYAQVIPGQNNNKGRGTGLIEAYDFNTIIESIRLVDSTKRIRKSTLKALKIWFESFADWCENNYGIDLSKENNNISLSYDVTMVNMYLFADNNQKARKIADNFAERRIHIQIREDGSQPAELVRTQAFTYSISNLKHILDFCYLAKSWDSNYYNKNGELVNKAFDYLNKYIDNPDEFPYQQLTSWENCRKALKSQLLRREALLLSK